MRTFFDIVLGLLLTVLKAILHAFLSSAGLLALCAAVAFASVYAWRMVVAHRRSSRAENVFPINR